MEKYKEKIIKQCEKGVYSKPYIWIYMDILAIKREPLRDSCETKSDLKPEIKLHQNSFQ